MRLRLRLSLAAALLVLSLVVPAPSLATTHVSGQTYNSNTTWTLSGSPYVIDGNVAVASGVTLTVDPGVVVKMNGTFRTLSVDGTLYAVGTSSSRITFTSIQDDSIAGDTGGDGATSGSAGQWWKIGVGSSGTLTFDYVDVKYGGWGFADYTGGEVSLGGGSDSATIDHSNLTYSQTSGLLVGGGSTSPWPTATVDHSTFSNNHTGIYVNMGTLTLRNNSNVQSNTLDGVAFNLTGSFTGTASTITHSQLTSNGEYGVYYQPGSGIGSSYEPTGHYNNIYSNSTKQYYSPSYKPQLDWTNNYWGSGTYTWYNPTQCLLSWPYSGEHVAQGFAALPDGPITWDHTYVVVNRETFDCAIDYADGIPYETSAVDNSGY
jgi:hypothetical protein